VIALDTNLLVYAHRADAPGHREALRVLEDLARGGAPWAVPWPCVHEFLAIVTHPRIFRPPTPLAVALDAVESWMGSPSVALLEEAGDHWAGLRSLLEAGAVEGPRVHDARVAAICVSHGVRELWTADRDFSRFPGLRVRNPLVP